jgi:putative membrane protein
MWHGSMWGWGGMPMFGFGMLWWLLVVVIVVLAVRMVGRGERRDRPGDSAESILRERYARGEIDKAEFDTRLRDLTQARGR